MSHPVADILALGSYMRELPKLLPPRLVFWECLD